MNRINRNTINTMRRMQSVTGGGAKVSFISVSPSTFDTNHGQFGPPSPKKRKVEPSKSEPMPTVGMKGPKVDVSIKNVDYNDGDGAYDQKGVVNTLTGLSQNPFIWRRRHY